MRRIISGILAIAALLSTSTPALADGHHHRGGGGGTTTAILSGVAGVAVGALGAGIIDRRQRASQSYQSGYPSSYQTNGYVQQAYPQQTYQERSYQQPAYQQGYQQDSQAGYSGYDQGYAPPPLPQRRFRPAPNGVRCLTWNGQGYVPMRC